jgi:NADH dehydrogenase (ubiquinone) 1 beta subcomplex subunit 11
MSLFLRLNRLNALKNAVATSQRSCRLISTSPKKSDTATIDSTTTAKTSETKTEENWVSWGWDLKNKEADRNWMNSSFFFSVTLGLVVAGFYLAYSPDNFYKDWAQREAFLELRRREAAGLPAIDCNYVDPAKIELPSDEELGETEIII